MKVIIFNRQAHLNGIKLYYDDNFLFANSQTLYFHHIFFFNRICSFGVIKSNLVLLKCFRDVYF